MILITEHDSKIIIFALISCGGEQYGIGNAERRGEQLIAALILFISLFSACIHCLFYNVADTENINMSDKYVFHF